MTCYVHVCGLVGVAFMLSWAFQNIISVMGFNSNDTAQYMMCAIGRIHNGHKVVFGFKHATLSHHTELLASIEYKR